MPRRYPPMMALVTKVRARAVEKFCKDLNDMSRKISIIGNDGLSEQCFKLAESVGAVFAMFVAVRANAKTFMTTFSSVHENELANFSPSLICSILTKIMAELSSDFSPDNVELVFKIADGTETIGKLCIGNKVFPEFLCLHLLLAFILLFGGGTWQRILAYSFRVPRFNIYIYTYIII